MPTELKTKIILTKFGYLLFFLVIPILIINDKYQVFSDSPPILRITGGLVMSIFVFFYFIKGIVRRFINWLSPGPFKIIFISVYKSLPLVAAVCIMWASLDAIRKFVVCFSWVTASLVVANVIDAFDDYYVQEWKEIKLTKRQDKYRRKYNI